MSIRKSIATLVIIEVCISVLQAQSTNQFLVPFLEDGLWGFMNARHELVVVPKFEEAFPSFFGRARVKCKGKYGFLGTDGEFVIRAKYDDARDFTFGIAHVTRGNRKYAITANGKPNKWPREIHGTHRRCVTPILQKHLIFQENKKYGFVYEKYLREGTTLHRLPDTIPAQFDTIIPVTHQLMFVQKGEHGAFLHEGSICTDAEKILERLEYKYEDILLFDARWDKGMVHEIVGVKLNDLWGYATLVHHAQAKEIITPKYLSISSLESGFALVHDKNGYPGYVSDNGEEYFHYILKQH